MKVIPLNIVPWGPSHFFFPKPKCSKQLPRRKSMGDGYHTPGVKRKRKGSRDYDFHSYSLPSSRMTMFLYLHSSPVFLFLLLLLLLLTVQSFM
jgi:hypothetical protein